MARQLDLDLPMLGNLLPSNRLQIDECITRLTEFRRDGIGLLGLSFKPGTDDLRYGQPQHQAPPLDAEAVQPHNLHEGRCERNPSRAGPESMESQLALEGLRCHPRQE